MANEVKWTIRAKESFERNVAYLQAEWTDREIENFINATTEKIKLISIFPELFSATDRRKHIHKTIITKQIILFYRHYKKLGRIELLVFWDSRSNPSNLKL
jgi:plasmid stabilization system protein ParE